MLTRMTDGMDPAAGNRKINNTQLEKLQIIRHSQSLENSNLLTIIINENQLGRKFFCKKQCRKGNFVSANFAFMQF